jgi:zinc D-Ala-D-Ala carboxypeptidase
MSKYAYFDIAEFDCSQSGSNKMEPAFLEKLDELREIVGWSFQITSGYRDLSHSAEVNKLGGGGYHTKGIACDVRVHSGKQKHELIKAAMAHGWTGIGVAKTFIHLDTREDTPVVWSY